MCVCVRVYPTTQRAAGNKEGSSSPTQIRVSQPRHCQRPGRVNSAVGPSCASRWGVEQCLRPLPTRCQSQPPDTPISLQLLYPSQAQPCPSHQKLYSLGQKPRGREPNVNHCAWFASVFKGSNQLSTSRTSPVSFRQFGKLEKTADFAGWSRAGLTVPRRHGDLPPCAPLTSTPLTNRTSPAVKHLHCVPLVSVDATPDASSSGHLCTHQPEVSPRTWGSPGSSPALSSHKGTAHSLRGSLTASPLSTSSS